MRTKTRTPPSKAVVENAPIQSLINSCAMRSYRMSFDFQPINSMITANIGTPRIKDPNSRWSWAAIHAAFRLPIFGKVRYSASVTSCANTGAIANTAISDKYTAKYEIESLFRHFCFFNYVLLSDASVVGIDLKKSEL